MSKQPEVVKQSELLNQFVLDRSTMAEIGQIEVMWMYPKVHRVLGFICKSGWLGAKKTAFNLDQLQTIGSNGILVNSQPVETNAEKVRQLDTLIHWEVWTDAGNKAGKITDYLFNLRTGAIEHYLFVTSDWSGLTGSAYLLPPNYILRVGNRRVLVSEAAVRSFAVYREGIQEKLSKVTDFLKEEKTQVAQEWRSWVDQAKSATEIARERAQILAEQAKERAQILAEQAKETGQTFVEQVKEKTHDWAEPTEPGWDTPEVTVVPPDLDDFDPLEDWDDEELAEPTVTVKAESIAEPLQDPEPLQNPRIEFAADRPPQPPAQPPVDPSDSWDDWEDEDPEPTVQEDPATPDRPAMKPPQPDQDLADDDDDPWI